MTRRCEVVLGDAIGFGRERPDIGDDPSQTQIRDNEQRPWRKKRCNRVSRRNDAKVATLNVVACSIGSDSTRAAPKLRHVSLTETTNADERLPKNTTYTEIEIARSRAT